MSLQTSENRNRSIDALRGVSILSVILLHINIQIPFSNSVLGGMIAPALYKIIFWSGYFGVCIFFVISGFLITSSTLSKWNKLQDINLKEFYVMRFARIIPLLLALVIILSIMHLAGVQNFIINPQRATLIQTIVAALTFHINILEINVGYLPGSWDILWSLSTEEFFYFFFPIICFFIRREWQFIAVVSIFLFISPFARTSWYAGIELGDRNYFAYLDTISLGCIAAIIARRINFSRGRLLIVAMLGWIMFLSVMLFRKYVSILGLNSIGLNVTLLSIGTALILIWMKKKNKSDNTFISSIITPLVWLGKNSYEVYLTHMFIVYLFIWLFRATNLSGGWIYLLYSVIIVSSGFLGQCTADYFSNPINKIIREKASNFLSKA